MFTGFENLVEERIRRAQQRGLFENLAGAGKPLPPDVITSSQFEGGRVDGDEQRQDERRQAMTQRAQQPIE